MTLGQKIKKLRIDKNLTQKDLADQLHVAFQTVSKWEADTNEPDVATLRELAKLFDCSIDYLLSEEEIEKTQETTPIEQTVVAPVNEPITKTIIVHQKELHVCARCGKDIPEDELAVDHVAHRHRVGRHTNTTYSDVYYHKGCLQEKRSIEEAEANRKRNYETSRAKKICFGWSIAGGVISLGVALGVLLAVPACQAALNPGLAVLFSVLIGYMIFATVYCILSGSYIGSVFVTVSSWSIKFPGLIFSWDLDGLMWLIAMKILFLILGVFVSLFTLGLAITLSGALAMISFPFVLIHNINCGYSDSLVHP